MLNQSDINAGRGIWAVVPAAGGGRRMGAAIPKQYLDIHGQALLLHTLRALAAHPAIVGIQLVLAADDAHWPRLEAQARASLSCALQSCTGGAARADSVLAGLQALPDSVSANDWVLVHDAARPCLSPVDINHLLAVLQIEVDAAILAVPIADTVKQADGEFITATLPRESLWRALTPQAARRRPLADALQDAKTQSAEVTDEASALERLGLKPRLIQGRSDNIKVTTPTDLQWAAMLLARTGSE